MSNNRRWYQYKDKYFEFVETEHWISIYEILSANCKVEKKFIINLGKSQPLKEYRKEELYVEWYLSSIDLETYSLGRRDGRNKISFLTFDSYLQWLLRSHQTKDVLVNPHLERELDWTYTYLVESENNRDIDFSLLSQINLKNTHNLITKNLLWLHNKDIRNASKYLTQFQERREREWLVYLTEETQYTKLLTQLKENILQSNYTPFLELSETDLEFYCKDTLDVILGKKVLDIWQGLKSEWSVFAHSTLLNTPLFFNKELNCFITLLEQSCYNYFWIPTYNFYKSLNTK